MVKIMLDAGHGLNTPGKRSTDGSLHEWSFNSVVAKYVADLLAQYENTTTYFAHDVTGAVDIPLQQRTDKANKLGVDAYISFHANAGDSKARGLETYIHPVCPPATVALGKAIHESLIKITGVLDRGLKRADFQVLRETKMNAVLIEHEFMTNAQSLALLKSDDFRHKCAQGTVNALVSFYGLKKKAAPQPEADSADGKLVRGEKGPNVQVLNQWLHELGYTFKQDDLYDQYTEAALLAFQKEHGLPQDAVYTSAIGDVIQKAIADKKAVKAFALDVVGPKAPGKYRLAKFVDTDDPKVIDQYKQDGYKVVELP
jgi:N-acetylmuramoyl-L-alanine amidase